MCEDIEFVNRARATQGATQIRKALDLCSISSICGSIDSTEEDYLRCLQDAVAVIHFDVLRLQAVGLRSANQHATKRRGMAACLTARFTSDATKHPSDTVPPCFRDIA